MPVFADNKLSPWVAGVFRHALCACGEREEPEAPVLRYWLLNLAKILVVDWKKCLWLALFSLGLWSADLARAAEVKKLRGHVPLAARKQQPASRVAPARRLELAIGLPLRNAAALTNLLQQLYDPGSPNFRSFLTPEQFTEQFGPSDADYQTVMAFAQTNGFTITGTHPNRVLLNVSARAEDIERAFHVALSLYPHPTEAREFYAPDREPSIDANIPVLDVSGLSDFGRPHPMHLKKGAVGARPNGTGSAGGDFIGNDFRAAYVPGTWLRGSNQVVGLLQFDGFYSSDIAAYESRAGLTNVPIQTVLLDGFDGTPTPGASSGNAEVSLDIEMVVAMAPGLAKIIVYEGSPNNFIPNDPLNRMATDNLARQLSSSWGWTGGPSETTDQILQQFAAQGQSFFQASGDSDAYTGAGALDQFGKTTTPMDSPYVTSVGGTTLMTSGPGGPWQAESVWNWGSNQGSGGGVSTYYSIPGWQSNVSMTANLGSSTMRNIPDVALTADGVLVVHGNGSSGTFGGTSCAAPLWAGFMALINQQAALAGQAPIGFINPAIYALARGPDYLASFHDITNGNNIGANTPGQYYAVAGYDLCTGWGTPTGTSLINALAPLAFVPVIRNNGWSLVSESSAPANTSVDPGETVTLSFSLRNTGPVPTSNLVATLQANGGVVAPSPPRHYGALAAFNGTGSQSFTFTASGSCGSSIMATLQLSDGTNVLTPINFPLSLGSATPAQTFAQNFDSVSTPSLPAGWTTSVVSGTATNWVTTSSSKDTTPNSAFCRDITGAGANALISPIIPIALSSAQLAFRQNSKFENSGNSYFDGGVLEIRIASGPFIDILAAGGSFVSGGYNGVLAAGSGNPLEGRQAWVGSGSGWKSVTVNLPASAAGQPVEFRWICATDSGNQGSATGWYVDSIALHDAALSCNTVTADVAALLSVSAASLVVGRNLEYTITVTNAGPQPAAGVMVTDTLPANVSFISASPGCNSGLGRVVCPVGMLPAGAWTNYTVIVAPESGELFTNIVSATTVTPDPSALNNTAVLAVLQTGVGPQITVGPTKQLVVAGGSAMFQISANGTAPLSYQWFFNATNPLAGATTETLTLANVQPADAGDYRVVVTNAYGSATSSVAQLVLAQPPYVLTQPTNQLVLAGGPGSFHVTATGTTPLSYQWFFNATNLLPGATLDTLMLRNVQPTDGGEYRVVVTNAFGSSTSSVAQLLIAQPPFIIIQPSNQIAVLGGSVSFQVSASGSGPLSYQWLFADTNLLADKVATTLTLTNVQPTDAGGYSVLVTNAFGSVTSTVANLLIAEPPSITLQPTGQTVAVGSNAVLNAAADGTGPLSYQWFFNVTNALSGATTETLSLTNIQPEQAGAYTLFVTNIAGSVLSDPVTLRVLVPPIAAAPSVSTSDGQASVSFLSLTGLVYTLEYSPTLLPAQWTPIQPSMLGTGDWMVLQDTNSVPLSSTRFYRIRCE